jgi:hypothetical protein
LGCQNSIQDIFHALEQLGIFTMLQAVERTLESLMDIRVEGVVPAERTVEYTGSLIEVGDVPVLLQAIQCVRDCHLVMGLQTRAPEPTPQLHAVVSYLCESVDCKVEIGSGAIALGRSENQQTE